MKLITRRAERAIKSAHFWSYKKKIHASKDNDDLSYLWASYTHICYKGDMGEVTISPTYRLQKGKPGEIDYSRNKIEITTQVKFK